MLVSFTFSFRFSASYDLEVNDIRLDLVKIASEAMFLLF